MERKSWWRALTAIGLSSLVPILMSCGSDDPRTRVYNQCVQDCRDRQIRYGYTSDCNKLCAEEMKGGGEDPRERLRRLEREHRERYN